MSELISTIIPELNQEVKIYPFDAKHILVECNNHQLKLKRDFEILIGLVNGTNTIKQITEQNNKTSSQKITSEFLHKLLFKELAPYGIIKSDAPIKVRERSLHLRLSFIFWKGKSLDAIGRVLAFLFNPFPFYLSFVLMSVFTIGLVFYYKGKILGNAPLNVTNIFLFTIFSFTILILHELGHTAACNKFGAKHKGIGFGFYLLSPVFFADVSDTWKLCKQERIIVNLAGIYIEFIVATFLGLLFLFFHNPLLYYVNIAILIHIAINLNPFLKYDGYWILSDLTNVTNLRSQSTQFMKDALNIKKLKRFSTKEIMLSFYALISYFSIGLFLFFALVSDKQAIIYFPMKIIKCLINIKNIHYFFEVNFFEKLLKNSIPFIFYFFLGNLLYNTFKTYLNNKKNLLYEK
ncbi:MAG TPA: hypothetical protein VK835_13890 [Bacteroidia bacterium]|jgi:putative peptide zinc metalloprotease protein|nr:hypothetical protein [Bacteroidia bacterium]